MQHIAWRLPTIKSGPFPSAYASAVGFLTLLPLTGVTRSRYRLLYGRPPQSNTTCVVPSRYALFNASLTIPRPVRSRRTSDSAGRERYRRVPRRQIRSSFLRSRVFTATPACNENPRPCQAALYRTPLPRRVSSAMSALCALPVAHGYSIRDRVVLQLLQRILITFFQRQCQIIALLISGQPSLAWRPRRSRYRATRSLIVTTNALSSLLVGALT
ncbi:MAG: hypothetical protein ACJAZF_004489 [Granulosicoccus sp.]